MSAEIVPIGRGREIAAERIGAQCDTVCDQAWTLWQQQLDALPSLPEPSTVGLYKWPREIYDVLFEGRPEAVPTEVSITGHLRAPFAKATIALQGLQAVHGLTMLLPSQRMERAKIADATSRYTVVLNPLVGGWHPFVREIARPDKADRLAIAQHVSSYGVDAAELTYTGRAGAYMANVLLLVGVLDPSHRHSRSR